MAILGVRVNVEVGEKERKYLEWRLSFRIGEPGGL